MLNKRIKRLERRINKLENATTVCYTYKVGGVVELILKHLKLSVEVQNNIFLKKLKE